MSHPILLEPIRQSTKLLDNSPLVSVIVLCFNHSAFVTEALESVRCQTYKNIQLIIIDDCSSDHSVEVIETWMKKHRVSCLFIAHKSNQGVIKTLNEAISLAQGKYIARVPGDDKWVLDKLEYQVLQMENLSEEVGVLYSESYRIDSQGHKIDKMFIEAHRDFSNVPTGDIFPFLLQGNFIPGNTTLIRTSCYHKVGLYDQNLCYEDWDMWLRMSFHYQFFFSNKISAYYRILPTSLSNMLFSSKNTAVTLSNFKMMLKYYDNQRVKNDYPNYLVYWLKVLSYELIDLRYKKRSFYLYKTWRYQFDIRLFIYWILSCFNASQHLERKTFTVLSKIKNIFSFIKN